METLEEEGNRFIEAVIANVKSTYFDFATDEVDKQELFRFLTGRFVEFIDTWRDDALSDCIANKDYQQ